MTALSLPNNKSIIDATDKFRKIVGNHPRIGIRVDNLPSDSEDAQFITDFLFLAASEVAPKLIRRINFLEEKLNKLGVNPDEPLDTETI